MFRRRLACRQAVELVTDCLEGALSARDRERFETHLHDCPNCTEYLAQMRAMIEAVGHIEPDSLAPGVRAELVTLYRRWREP